MKTNKFHKDLINKVWENLKTRADTSRFELIRLKLLTKCLAQVRVPFYSPSVSGYRCLAATLAECTKGSQ